MPFGTASGLADLQSFTAIKQMSYLIFLKRLEGMDNARLWAEALLQAEARAAAAKRTNESYNGPRTQQVGIEKGQP